MDSMCLVEAVWWGQGERLYAEHWVHGIYEFRDVCYAMSQWAQNGWEHLCEKLDTEVCFDTEFCPALVCYYLSEYADIESSYFPTPYTVQRFVDEWIQEQEV